MALSGEVFAAVGRELSQCQRRCRIVPSPTMSTLTFDPEIPRERQQSQHSHLYPAEAKGARAFERAASSACKWGNCCVSPLQYAASRSLSLVCIAVHLFRGTHFHARVVQAQYFMSSSSIHLCVRNHSLPLFEPGESI